MILVILYVFSWASVVVYFRVHYVYVIEIVYVIEVEYVYVNEYVD